MKEHWDLAVMSKELATINVNAEFPYELAEAKLENIYTEEAYAWFQKLQFKNLLNRFDVKAPSNKIEDYFHEIRNRKEAEAVFEKADGAGSGSVFLRRTTIASVPGRICRYPGCWNSCHGLLQEQRDLPSLISNHSWTI